MVLRRCRFLTVPDVHKLLHVQAFSPREFINTIVTQDRPPAAGGRRSCIVVSVPREGVLNDKAHALGVYVSVETVRELGDGRVEIVMASVVSAPLSRVPRMLLTPRQSDAGGSIPRFVQNMAIASQLWGDGEKFLKYMRENPRD